MEGILPLKEYLPQKIGDAAWIYSLPAINGTCVFSCLLQLNACARENISRSEGSESVFSLLMLCSRMGMGYSSPRPSHNASVSLSKTLLNVNVFTLSCSCIELFGFQAARMSVNIYVLVTTLSGVYYANVTRIIHDPTYFMTTHQRAILFCKLLAITRATKLTLSNRTKP